MMDEFRQVPAEPEPRFASLRGAKWAVGRVRPSADSPGRFDIDQTHVRAWSPRRARKAGYKEGWEVRWAHRLPSFFERPVRRWWKRQLLEGRR
jgi:hypothetical protein